MVWNANFVNYFDVALTEFMREVRGPYSELIDTGVMAVVADIRLRFVAPARFDDILQVDLDLQRIGRTSMTVAMTIRRDETILVEGEARHVYLDTRSGETTPISTNMRSSLSPYLRVPSATAPIS
jgi:acyl-CoA thioester hydrolase